MIHFTLLKDWDKDHVCLKKNYSHFNGSEGVRHCNFVLYSFNDNSTFCYYFFFGKCLFDFVFLNFIS